jgi:hypothetical protein
MRPDDPRDPIVGPDSGPEPPFPLKLNGEVVKGFGRGSKEVSNTLSSCLFTKPNTSSPLHTTTSRKKKQKDPRNRFRRMYEEY